VVVRTKNLALVNFSWGASFGAQWGRAIRTSSRKRRLRGPPPAGWVGMGLCFLRTTPSYFSGPSDYLLTTRFLQNVAKTIAGIWQPHWCRIRCENHVCKQKTSGPRQGCPGAGPKVVLKAYMVGAELRATTLNMLVRRGQRDRRGSVFSVHGSAKRADFRGMSFAHPSVV